jgi:hypothetical protein
MREVTIMKAPGVSERKAAGLAAILAVASLAGSPAAAATDEQAWRVARPVSHESLERAPYGPWMEPCVMIVSSPEEWNSAMASAAASGEMIEDSGLEAPAVDWSRSAVLLVALGRRYQLGWSIEVTGVRRHGSQALIDVAVTMPNPDLATQSLSAPYEIVRIDAAGLRSAQARYESVSQGGPGMDPAGASPALSGIRPAAPSGDTGDDSASRVVSWGALKGIYR